MACGPPVLITASSAAALDPEVDLAKLLFACLLLIGSSSLAGSAIPLPFEGLYESRDSLAKEWLDTSRWREIPQDVKMHIVKDGDIIELRLNIEVHAPVGKDDSSKYTISNRIWLARKLQQSGNGESGRVDFDVYKKDSRADRFEDRGDGHCEPSECRFHYTTKHPGYRQRYHSRITWQPQHTGTQFAQLGGLSLKKDDESEWRTVKTWQNTFRRRPPPMTEGAYGM